MAKPVISLRMSHGPMPRQEQIRTYILDKIIGGDWPPDYKIPSENELVAALGVSRMTVHHALKNLRDQGFLVRVQGVGTFVAPPKAHMTIVGQLNIADEIRERGHRHSSTLISRKLRAPTQDEAKTFRFHAKKKLLHAIVLHREDDAPIQLEDRLLNPEMVPGAREQDATESTFFEYLMRLYPYPEGETKIGARMPTAAEGELLALDSGEPVLEVVRTTWSDEGVVTCVRLVYPASRYRLQGRIYPKGASTGE